MNYLFVRQSGNTKTGPIPVTQTEKQSCPASCPLKGNGCYAEAGRLNIHWSRLTARGASLRELTAQINGLLPGKLWRHNAAGDLAISGDRIDRRAVIEITRANTGRRGFTYTHLPPAKHQNASVIKWANANGFTINLSADNLTEADELAALAIAPIVTLLPSDQLTNTTTPAGRKVIICPNHLDKRVQCIDCGLCQKQRNAIVGFPAHGPAHKRASAIFHASKSNHQPKVTE